MPVWRHPAVQVPSGGGQLEGGRRIGSAASLFSVYLLALVSYTLTGTHKVVQVHCGSVYTLATLKHKK